MSTVLSIVVPCHNVEGKFNIVEGLRTVRSDEVEIIFVNDDSSDHTSELLERAEAGLQVTVKIINGVFGGPGGARNAGIQASVGRYLWLLDADDLAHPQPVINNLSVLRDGQIDLLSFQFVRRNSSATSGDEKVVITPDLKTGTIFQKLSSVNRLFPLLIKKSVLHENSISFRENVYMYEDALFILEVLHAAQDMMSHDGIICEYLIYSGSLSNSAISLRYLSKWQAIVDIMDFVRRRYPLDAEVFDNYYVKTNMSEDWGNYLDSGKYQELTRILPALIRIHKDHGFAHHFEYFLRSGSRKNRMLKRLAFPIGLLASKFVNNGLESIRKSRADGLRAEAEMIGRPATAA